MSNQLKGFLGGLSIILFLGATTVEDPHYQISTTSFLNSKGKAYIVETVIDTRTGKVVKRKKISASKYKLPYKDNRGRTIKED